MQWVSCYVLASRCPVRAYVLRTRYALSGTEVWYQQASATLCFGAKGDQVAPYAYRPTRALGQVRY
eukprot:988206-Rhodomonas_salina.1